MRQSERDELGQLDLSHLRLQDMTPTQRAELRRRYADFVRHFGKPGAPGKRRTAAQRSRARKWVPGERG